MLGEERYVVAANFSLFVTRERNRAHSASSPLFDDDGG